MLQSHNLRAASSVQKRQNYLQECGLQTYSGSGRIPQVLPLSQLAPQHVLGAPLLQPRCDVRTCAAATGQAPALTQALASSSKRPLKVLIAGAGIGGLVLAVGLLKQGFQVQVFERDLTAIRGEGKYRGPIQVQSNALAALEAIDEDAYHEVLNNGCITGDRVNGLCDGLTGDWYVKFDTFHPAVDAGLPVTRVISRVFLQQVLAKAVTKYGGTHTIMNGAHVTSFVEQLDPVSGINQVHVTLEGGVQYSGDLLVGADGIWSKIRKQLIGETQANYSGYTCYTGISDFTPADIDIVGYRVFLGNGQYFVSSDVGGGKQQWYGFYREPAGGSDPAGCRKRRLLELFGKWNDNVVDLIKATPEEDILRRDIFDRAPIFSWAEGRVALLGDSAHAMQPNLGQGGCMAIEDGYALAADLGRAVQAASGDVTQVDVPRVLKQYQDERIMRVSTIHGMAGMAAFMASTYKCYLGEGWAPLLGAEFERSVTALRIPHPGRVVGRLAMMLTMPAVLGWVLGGNVGSVERVGYCRLGDAPRAFHESEFQTFMNDDTAITAAAHADWLLVSERNQCMDTRTEAATTTSQLKGVYINEHATHVGRVASSSCRLVIDDPRVEDVHARVWCEPRPASRLQPASSSSSHVHADSSASTSNPSSWHSTNSTSTKQYCIEDLGSSTGTYVNGRRLAPGHAQALQPGDVVEFGASPSEEQYKIKMQHVTLRTDQLSGRTYRNLVVGQRQESVDAEKHSSEEARRQARAESAMAEEQASALVSMMAGGGKGSKNVTNKVAVL